MGGGRTERGKVHTEGPSSVRGIQMDTVAVGRASGDGREEEMVWEGGTVMGGVRREEMVATTLKPAPGEGV